jgi:hypothetical protein
VSDHGGNHPAQRQDNILLKIYERDQPDLRVAGGDLRNAISHGLRLRFIATVYDGNNRDVTVGGGKLVAIDVGKGERVGVSGMELDRGRSRRGKDQEKEKILRPAENRA